MYSFDNNFTNSEMVWKYNKLVLNKACRTCVYWLISMITMMNSAYHSLHISPQLSDWVLDLLVGAVILRWEWSWNFFSNEAVSIAARLVAGARRFVTKGKYEIILVQGNLLMESIKFINISSLSCFGNNLNKLVLVLGSILKNFFGINYIKIDVI